MPKGAKGFADLFNRDAARDEQKKVKERQSKQGGKRDYWKPPKGKSVIRILPPGSERLMANGKMGKLVHKFFLWWEGKSQGIHICGRLTNPEKYDVCPIQEALDKVSGVVPAEQLKRNSPRSRGFFNVLIRKIESPEGELVDQEMYGKPVICDGPTGLYDFVQLGFTDPDIGFFIDPHNGADVIIRRTGEGLDTSYDYDVKPGKWGPILDTVEATDELTSKLPDLDAITMVSAEQMEKQVTAAKSILEWASQFGKVDQDLGIASSSLNDLLGATGGTTSEEKTEASTRNLADMQPATRTEEGAAAAPAPAAEKPAEGGDGRPECYGQFKDRNPGVEDGNATDEQCKECAFNLPCAFD